MQRCVVVTGASSGIGEQTAHKLLEIGCSVIGIARGFSKCGIQSDRFIFVSIDFSHLASLPDRLKRLTETHSDVTDVVCCAGAGRFGGLEEFSYAQMQDLINVNFLSQAYVVRAFLPQLKKRAFGNIVLLGSEAALSGGRKGAIYCASKFALRGFAQSLREECAANGVHVGVVNPGMVRTGFFDELDFSPGDSPHNFIEPEDVAQTIIFMITARPGTVVDEINMSPLKKVVVKKTSTRS
jgi:short-subunit dehydrogenase